MKGGAPAKAKADSSEQELQRELNLPRGVGRLGDHPRRRAEISAREGHGIGQREVCAIQHVESLDPELQPVLFGETEVLEQRRVKIGEPRSNEGSARHVTECAGKRQRESIRIEIPPCLSKTATTQT